MMSDISGIYTISTKESQLAVKALGAELTSWQADLQTEYLHQPDWQWSGQAPLLFPFVGGLSEQIYAWQGKKYHMPKHGFLRERLFTLQKDKTYQNAEEACICLAYKSTKDDLAIYPFPFAVEAYFYLHNHSLKQELKITNLAKTKMYFACGFHPAFNLPKSLGRSVNDFALRFINKDQLEHLQLDFASGLQKTEVPHTMPLIRQNWNWQADDFDRDCWFFQTSGSDIELVSKVKQKTLLHLQSDLNILGVWQPYAAETGANFICLEPWSSSVGPLNKLAELSAWPDRLSLEPEQSYTATYTVTAKY